MRCHSVQQRLLAYVDGRLSDDEYAAVGGHLQGCPTCAAEIVATRRLCELLDRGAPETPAGLENAVMRRIRAGEIVEEAPPRLHWALPWAVGLAAAAGLAVYLGGGVDWLRGSPEGIGGDRAPSGIASKSDGRQVSGATVAASSESSPSKGARTQVASTAGRVGGSAEEAPPAGGEARVAATDDLPRELRDSPDLLVDFPIIDELDKFEHYDSIWAITNEHPGRPRGG